MKLNNTILPDFQRIHDLVIEALHSECVSYTVNCHRNGDRYIRITIEEPTKKIFWYDSVSNTLSQDQQEEK
jgi:hypothetical protein